MLTEERLTLKVAGTLTFGFTTVEKGKQKFPKAVSNFKTIRTNRIEILDQFITLEPGNYFNSNRKNYISNRSEKGGIKYLLVKKEFKDKMLEILNFYLYTTKQEVEIKEITSKRLCKVVVTVFRVSKCNLHRLPKDLTLSLEDLKNFITLMFEEKGTTVRRVKRIIKQENEKGLPA